MARCLERFGFGRDTWYRAVRRGDVMPVRYEIDLEALLFSGAGKPIAAI